MEIRAKNGCRGAEQPGWAEAESGTGGLRTNGKSPAEIESHAALSPDELLPAGARDDRLPVTRRCTVPDVSRISGARNEDVDGCRMKVFVCRSQSVECSGGKTRYVDGGGLATKAVPALYGSVDFRAPPI